MLQAVRRLYSQLVRNSCPGQHPTVVVGGHRLDRRGADVDADCDRFGGHARHRTPACADVTGLRALVTAPLRGAGLDKLRQLVDVVYDPWVEQIPLRIYSAEQLAEQISSHAADVVVVESDSVSGPVFELGRRAIASTRGDPNNVDVAGATRAGVPVLYTPGRNADAVAEMAVALLLAATRHLLPADADVRAGEIFRDGTIPYQRFRGAELAGRTAGLVGLGAVGRALKWRLSGLGLSGLAPAPFRGAATPGLG